MRLKIALLMIVVGVLGLIYIWSLPTIKPLTPEQIQATQKELPEYREQ